MLLTRRRRKTKIEKIVGAMPESLSGQTENATKKALYLKLSKIDPMICSRFPECKKKQKRNTAKDKTIVLSLAVSLFLVACLLTSDIFLLIIWIMTLVFVVDIIYKQLEKKK